jgi:hypothetical protein
MRCTPCSLSRPPTNAIARSRAGLNIPTTLRCVRAEFLQAYSCKHSSGRFPSLKRQAWWQSFDMRGIGSGPPQDAAKAAGRFPSK